LLVNKGEGGGEAAILVGQQKMGQTRYFLGTAPFLVCCEGSAASTRGSFLKALFLTGSLLKNVLQTDLRRLP